MQYVVILSLTNSHNLLKHGSCSELLTAYVLFLTGIQRLSQIYQRNWGRNATSVYKRYAQSWDKFSVGSVFSSQCVILHMDH